ncbi:hypothetical protein K450DRAFT_253677 [Umbelopsis ramanniana AG]|uniref:Spermatogenesis-associated protein 20-like TRX domain-containing protein n=1 Tax=Umbelopsis ramanniana AG TaxID=1314678 RepID=A0AAD5E7K5_UMBRA|nr:uncharacterized protein K450DRAFT_253677 [Umbelopsis ramanniana AG]KAI8577105.1 hypothetical protein K450DRAFT_253677 [Umbelopsis ramanniana AG]
MTETPKFTNRLAKEKSPYLLQHAHNPVDWYPWGKEAFDKAVAENKVIFLSVGYSTCHWCHVMEHESFESEEVADIMNKFYVNIKVDREENPGVDKMYMTYVQLTSGRGGWPMSVFLTPDKYPIFGATYFPPDDKHGRPGFKTVLKRVAQMWEANPDTLKENATDTIEQLRSYAEQSGTGSAAMDFSKITSSVYEHLESSYDSKQGGFGGAPKFPTSCQFAYLLDYHHYMKKEGKKQAQKALDMVLFTLKKIAHGGIHDHVGNGFHRYSTDDQWHVPHFEKMLYDQAQLLSTYASAYKITKDDFFADTMRDIIKYVERDLQHDGGGFYSAEDADSYPEKGATKKLEGAFCVWEKSELTDILGEDDADIFSHHYDVKKNGNVDPAQDPHGELEGKNVLIERSTASETAKQFNITEDQVNDVLNRCKDKLWALRLEKRPKPHRDDKILTSWNGLMISGLAQAAQALQDPKIGQLAEKAALFIKNNMYQADSSTLIRSYREGPSSIEGFLEDYAFLIQGLIDLYETSPDEQWIEWADQLQKKQDEVFYDSKNGGYFSVAETDKSILLRMKDESDGAEPSGNAVALKNLLRLGQALEDHAMIDRAGFTVTSFHSMLTKYPFAMPALVSSYMMYDKGVKQVITSGPLDDPTVKEFHRLVNETFLPNKLLVHAQQGSFIASKNPTVSTLTNQDQKPLVHICENFTCGMPMETVEELEKSLQ